MLIRNFLELVTLGLTVCDINRRNMHTHAHSSSVAFPSDKISIDQVICITLFYLFDSLITLSQRLRADYSSGFGSSPTALILTEQALGNQVLISTVLTPVTLVEGANVPGAGNYLTKTDGW